LQPTVIMFLATIELVLDDEAEGDATVTLPPIQRDFTDAQLTTVSSAATERAQSKRNGGHDDVTSPPYPHELVSGHTDGVSTVLAPCIPFGVMKSGGFPGDALLSHLVYCQVGFDARLMLRNASEHLRTRVQTIFDTDISNAAAISSPDAAHVPFGMINIMATMMKSFLETSILTIGTIFSLVTLFSMMVMK
jgi:hypothetical protein